MLGLFSRRRARAALAISRAVAESLEGRTFFDVQTFSVTDPAVAASWGVVTTQSDSNVWTHEYAVTENNLPDHSHSIG